MIFQKLSIFFFVVFILVFTASVTGYVYRDSLKESLHSSLNQTILEYGSGGLLDKDWDRIQENVCFNYKNQIYWNLFLFQLECCGVDSFSDWIHTEWATENRTFPNSCCRDMSSCDNVNVEQIYPNGCYPEILSLLKWESIVSKTYQKLINLFIAITWMALELECFWLPSFR